MDFLSRIVSSKRFDSENVIKKLSQVRDEILLAENFAGEFFTPLLQFLFRDGGGSLGNFCSSRGVPVSASNCDAGFPEVRLEGQAACELRYCFSEVRL